MMKAKVITLGCKVNQYESEAMLSSLLQHGFAAAEDKETADVVILNSCTVTAESDRKVRQIFRRAKKDNPDAVMVLTGCMAQAFPEDARRLEEADIILGTSNRKRLVPDLLAFLSARQRIIDIAPHTNDEKFENLNVENFTGRTRAFVKIEDGCNRFCSYCIIPYARGRVRSKPLEDLKAELAGLGANGYKEVVLTGIHLSSYGVDFPEDKKETLLSLIQAVNEVEGIQRIRLGSLEPGIVTEEFAKELSSMSKVCPHFHLSLQSGCDTTLERMNRRYRSAEYKARCELLRNYFGNPALTTDVIVGFPMETEEDFQASYDFVKDIHFYETHIFKYSRRHGTKAAAMSGQLTEAEKAVRSDKMLELHQKRAAEYETSLLGKTLEVLLEEEVEIDGKAYYLGHSREYVKVAVLKTEEYGVNDILAVKVEKTLQPHILQGEEIQVL